MASFLPLYLKKLDGKIGHLHIQNLPVNLTNKIGEGPSALIYKHVLRNKGIKKQFSKKKLMEIASQLVKLQNVNVVFIYLHNKKIIHRDFNPSNLLVQGDLNNITIKVADFDGLYLMKETISATLTSYHMKGMTLSYVAPEICANQALTPSYASDVYSWAITAYEILSNVSSPWENVLANLSDEILFRALSSGKIPNIATIDKLYLLGHTQKITQSRRGL